MTLLQILKALPLLGLTLLSACETSGTNVPLKYDLAAVPGDIRVCFVQVTGKPQSGVMTQKEVVALVGNLRSSEVSKTNCGRRLLALYDKQSATTRIK
jgi:hypothetical protein